MNRIFLLWCIGAAIGAMGEWWLLILVLILINFPLKDKLP
jgi:hypothetical protein